MTDHLPECDWQPDIDHGDGSFTSCICICDRLRACEARVEKRGRLWQKLAYNTGLAEARDALVALPKALSVSGGEFEAIWRDKALAAIDALRGEL